MLRTKSGKTIDLGKRLATGTQGEIFEVLGHSDLVFKRYFPSELAKDPSLEARLISMTANRPTGWREPGSNHVVLTWPTDVVYDAQNFVGYVMPRIDPSKSALLLQVSDPSDRTEPGSPLPWLSGFSWRYLVTTAVNLASAVEALHKSDIVIGDFNDLNVLVTHQARVTLVDCDSMQFKDPGATKTFLCRVFKNDFLAPELSGLNLQITPRQPPSDLFALAVHIHKLLLEGEHPFRGLWHGAGDSPKEIELAKKGVWIYAGGQIVGPRPGAIDVDILPPDIIKLFRETFVDGATSPGLRPDAATWYQELKKLSDNLTVCKADSRHWYSTHAGSCPWCVHQGQGQAKSQIVLPPATPAPSRSAQVPYVPKKPAAPLQTGLPLPVTVPPNISKSSASTNVSWPVGNSNGRLKRLLIKKAVALVAAGTGYFVINLTGAGNANAVGIWSILIEFSMGILILAGIASFLIDWS